jgi:amidase
LRLLWAATSPGIPTEQFQEIPTAAKQLPPEADGYWERFMRASAQHHRDWLLMHEAREQYRVRWAEFFRHYDVLLCPVVPTAAIPHDHSEPQFARTLRVNGQEQPYLDIVAWAGVIGMAYLPATVAPIGRASGGLPVGVQIVGPYLEDRTPIDFARRLADVIGGFEAPSGYE